MEEKSSIQSDIFLDCMEDSGISTQHTSSRNRYLIRTIRLFFWVCSVMKCIASVKSTYHRPRKNSAPTGSRQITKKLSVFRFRQKWEWNRLLLRKLITGRKRSLRRLCFHRCLSVHKELVGLCLGVSVSVRGVSVSVEGVSVSVEGVSASVCVWGGSRSLFWGSLSRGGGSLLGRPPPPYSNEWAVRILLECILVLILLEGFLHRFMLNIDMTVTLTL